MFSLVSFKANGEPIEHAGEIPAFFGLLLDGKVIEYFGSLSALHSAMVLFKGEL